MRRLLTVLSLTAVAMAVHGPAPGQSDPDAPGWAVECLPRIADWAYGPPLFAAEPYSEPWPGVRHQDCYYWSEGDAEGALILTLSWVTAAADPADVEYRDDCPGRGEFTDESETRGTSGGITSDTHRAAVFWDGDADLPVPPNEARHAAAEMLLLLEDVAVACPGVTGVGDAAPPVAAFDDEASSTADGGISPVVVAVGAAAVAGAGAVALNRARRRRLTLGDRLAAAQIRGGLAFGFDPFAGFPEPPPEAPSPPPEEGPPSPPQGAFDELAREHFTAEAMETLLQPFEPGIEMDAAAEAFHEQRRRDGR